MDERDMYLFLSSLYMINKLEIEILKDEFGKLENLMYIDKEKILKNNRLIEKLNLKLLRNIVKYRRHSRIDKIKKDFENKKIKYVCYCDEDYPTLLKEIDTAPAVLFYKGDISFLKQENTLAIIGSRTPTEYGLYYVKKFGKELSDEGISIISGLALGIDSEAHIACMEGKYGKTVAVLGSPLDNILPVRNRKLADKILENGGALVSEFFLGTKVKRLNFILRNRIISGLSKGVFVIEAAEKSGTSWTVGFAEEDNREVFAIPGSLKSAKSKGCNYLLKDGANLVMEVEDITKHYKISSNFKKFSTLNNSKDSIEYDIKDLNCEKKAILNLIKKQGEIKIDDICNLTGIDIKTINSNINELLIDDYIIEMENKTYGFNV